MAQINDVVFSKIREFIAALPGHGIKAQAVYLFGSYAKGTQTELSDIDVAVVSQDLSGDRFEELVRLLKISAEIDSRIEPVPFLPGAFVDEDPLAWEIRRKGVRV